MDWSLVSCGGHSVNFFRTRIPSHMHMVVAQGRMVPSQAHLRGKGQELYLSPADSQNKSMSEPKPGHSNSLPAEKDVKAPNLFERVKEEIEAMMHSEKHSEKFHDKETHGTSNDIDENTPVNEVKAPGVLERAKEEIEALIEAVHPKKESHDTSSPKR